MSLILAPFTSAQATSISESAQDQSSTIDLGFQNEDSHALNTAQAAVLDRLSQVAQSTSAQATAVALHRINKKTYRKRKWEHFGRIKNGSIKNPQERSEE